LSTPFDKLTLPAGRAGSDKYRWLSLSKPEKDDQSQRRMIEAREGRSKAEF
jgi:hypothetical protein